MIVARNVAYLSEVETTLSYSRKLAALGRLSAGIAHEVKNPLNATMIHLELLRMRLADAPEALEHVSVIAAQVRRLDEVVQGFLKFTRPEDLAAAAGGGAADHRGVDAGRVGRGEQVGCRRSHRGAAPRCRR